jgi:hypothetical protein
VSGDRLTGSDKRALLFWVLLGIVGAVYAQRYFFRAFPEASVDFRVSRTEALNRARNFVTRQGENVNGYQSAIIFQVDDDAKTYLERELGLAQANRLMSSELYVWYWDVRFFRPQQEEEFHVRISPAGNAVGYDHKVPEASPGAILDRAAAEARAQTFLSSNLGVDLNLWEFLPEEANSNRRPNRLDWSFTWEKRNFRAKDAPYRVQVGLQGDRIGGAQYYLQIPDTWVRSYKRLRSGNETLTLVFTVPYILLIGAAVWLGIRLTKEGQTSWRGAILLGTIVASLLFLQNLNDWPHWNASYDTNTSYSSFILTRIAFALLSSVLTALTVTLVLPAAEPLYRASQPQRLRLSKIFTKRGLRSKEFFSAAVVGLSMAAGHIGFIVAFYIVASHFGAWAPQELNYEDSVNTAFPWISGAAIGLLASTNEEFTFRLFAIPFFNRLTGSRWIAVIVPAFLWSFLHSNYPQEPPYIRGIEIGIIGIVAGLVMLRWGILATLIWHYTVDASLVGLLLIRSNSLYFKVSGLVVAAAAAAPLAFAGFSYLARGRFEFGEDLLNRAVPAPDISLVEGPQVPAAAVAGRRYDALSTRAITFLAICLLTGGLLAWRLKPEEIGDYLKLSVDARGARQLANEVLRQRGPDPNSYHHATRLVDTTDPVTNEFLRERGGIAHLNDIYAHQVPGALWHIRYFRDRQKEEFSVVLRPDGALHSVHHQIAEDTPGASLTKEEAIARAEMFLRDTKKIDLSQWTLVEANSDKRPHRLDHVLTWQKNTPLDISPAPATDTSNHAYARMSVVALGDEVTDYRTFIKIPDEWRRKQEEQTLPRTIINGVLRYAFLGGLAISMLILFLKDLRSEAARSVPWKRLSRWGLWGLFGYVLVVAFGNRLQMFLDGYDTAIPFKIFLASTGISLLLGALFYWGALAGIFGTAWYYGTRAFGQERLPDWTGMPKAYYRDGLWIGLGGAAGLLGLQALLATASKYWPTAHRAIESSFGSDFDAIVPVGSVLGSTLVHSLLVMGVVALVASFVAAQVSSTWLRVSLFVLGALTLTGTNWGGPADLAKQWLAKAIFLGVVVFGVRILMRLNVLGGFLVLACMALIGSAAELLGQPHPFYRANGYGVSLILLLLIAWPFAAWRMRIGNRAQADASVTPA